MIRIFSISLAILLTSCSSSKQHDTYIDKVNAHRKTVHKEFLSGKSPLPDEERTKFIGLNYFPIDSTFRIKARFQEADSLETIRFETNTDRVPVYTKYGVAHFELEGKQCSLTLYLADGDERETLFVPYTDKTCGSTTYYSGRYVDVPIKNIGDSVTLDFNYSYNPYCAYNDRYSCPIPPEENWLEVSINAGEKLYKSSH